MNSPYRNRQVPAGNPLANALVVVVGVIAIALSLVVGVVAFIALGSLFLVMAAIVGIRLWWARRRGGNARPRSRPAAGRDVIEGEFRVVTRPREDERD